MQLYTFQFTRIDLPLVMSDLPTLSYSKNLLPLFTGNPYYISLSKLFSIFLFLCSMIASGWSPLSS
jgi:hypothetical protein